MAAVENPLDDVRALRCAAGDRSGIAAAGGEDCPAFVVKKHHVTGGN
jgi:hypothetical protein